MKKSSHYYLSESLRFRLWVVLLKKTTKTILGTWTDVLNDKNVITFDEDNSGTVSSDDISGLYFIW